VSAKPVIRNHEYLRIRDPKQGEALDDVRNLIGTLQDQVTALLAKIAALEKG
jgi:hypothetical protein